MRIIPIKDRKGKSICDAWTQLNNVFKKAGAAPEMLPLDNEISKDLLDVLAKENMPFQLAPLCEHRNDLAELSMQEFKEIKVGLVDEYGDKLGV